MSTGPLAALPGSTADPGTGPAVVELFDTLFDDALLDDALLDDALHDDALLDDAATGAPDAGPGAKVDAGVAAHERLRAGWSADLVGPLVVPASAAELLSARLDPQHHRLRILLAADPPPADQHAARQRLRAARDLLAEDDRVELVGVRLAPPGPGGPAMAALLAALDFSVPSWVAVTPGPGSDDALRVLAQDGAEGLTLAAGPDPVAAGGLLRTAVDLGLAFRVTGGGAGEGLGPLAMLCAVRAALNGAGPAELAAILATRQPGPLASALRRMSAADAAVVRGFLVGIESAAVGRRLDELVTLGLLGPDLLGPDLLGPGS